MESRYPHPSGRETAYRHEIDAGLAIVVISAVAMIAAVVVMMLL